MSLSEVLNDVCREYAFSKSVVVKNVSYRLQVLSIDDEVKVNAFVGALSETDNPEDYFKNLRKEIVSRAIVEIKGEPVPEVVETPGGKKDKAIFLKDFLKRLPDAVVEKLFNVYVDIREEAESALDKEMRYDWFKTPEQRDKEYEDKLKKEKEKEENSKPDEELDDIKFKTLRETEPEIPSNNQQP